MPVKVDLQADGFRDALDELAALTPATKRASTRAQNKTLRWSRTQAASRLAKINNVPVKVMRERVRSFPAKPGKEFALLWLGVWPLPAAKAGRLSQTRSGAKAGRHAFAGAFVATMPAGAVGVFERAINGRRRTADRPQTSSPNLPIVPQYVQIEGAREVEQQLVSEGGRRYRDLMIQELNFELNVKGK